MRLLFETQNHQFVLFLPKEIILSASFTYKCHSIVCTRMHREEYSFTYLFLRNAVMGIHRKSDRGPQLFILFL